MAERQWRLPSLPGRPDHTWLYLLSSIVLPILGGRMTWKGGGVEMRPTLGGRSDGRGGRGRRHDEDASASGSEQYMMPGTFSRTNTLTVAAGAVIPSP